MTKKLYTACIEIEIHVVAESVQEARILALAHYGDDTPSPFDFDVEVSNRVANEWDGECLPYGKHDERDCAYWLAENKKAAKKETK